jgi:hypothetical protein
MKNANQDQFVSRSCLTVSHENDLVRLLHSMTFGTPCHFITIKGPEQGKYHDGRSRNIDSHDADRCLTQDHR